MRMRRKKNLSVRLARCAELLLPADGPGFLDLSMARGRRLMLELGCGKGDFIIETAKNDPDSFCIAVEREQNALVIALEKAMDGGPPNLLFLNCDAERLFSLFPPESIYRMYINFCDPWPHTRHAGRRLTHRDRLAVYRGLMIPGGELHFKTDNAPLFDFTIKEAESASGMELTYVCRNLHADGQKGIMTEYERRFVSQGMPIHRLEMRKTAPGNII